jgi:CheY-like chemotaxis protein
VSTTKRVIHIEDSPNIIEGVKTMLDMHNIKVVAFTTVTEGISHLGRCSPGEYHAAIVDYHTEGDEKKGTDFIHTLLTEHPEVLDDTRGKRVIVLASSTSRYLLEEQLEKRGIKGIDIYEKQNEIELLYLHMVLAVQGGHRDLRREDLIHYFGLGLNEWGDVPEGSAFSIAQARYRCSRDSGYLQSLGEEILSSRPPAPEGNPARPEVR